MLETLAKGCNEWDRRACSLEDDTGGSLDVGVVVVEE